MKKINFENAPSTNTPLSAENLNQMQDNMEEASVVISPTEPTTNEKVWFKKSNNLFNVNNYVQDSHTGYSLRNICEVGKEYTISLNNNPGGSLYGLAIVGYAGNAMTSDMWEKYTSYSATFTYTQAMYDNDYKLFIISTSDYAPISKETAENLNIMLQQGTTITAYEEHVEKGIHIKNANGVFEQFTDIETITNENGTAIKYPDGTMICTGKKTQTLDITYYASHGFYYNQVEFTYPISFTEVLSCQMQVENASNYAVYLMTGSKGDLTGTGSRLICSSTSFTEEITTSYIAIGRWK